MSDQAPCLALACSWPGPSPMWDTLVRGVVHDGEVRKGPKQREGLAETASAVGLFSPVCLIQDSVYFWWLPESLKCLR